MQEKIAQLKREILQIAALHTAATQSPPIIPDLGNRPVFLMAPMSHEGMQHGQRIAGMAANVIAAVDDMTPHGQIHGAPRWNSTDFMERIKNYPQAVGIDFSCSPRGRRYVRKLCESAGIEKISITGIDSPVIENFEDRPVFFTSAMSMVASMHAKDISKQHGNVIACIEDDVLTTSIHGIPCWNSHEFLKQAKFYPNALVVDFSCTPREKHLASILSNRANLKMVDCGLAIAHCGQAAVYEPAQVYRKRTLHKINEFMQFSDRLEDDFSVLTLYSNLMFRLTYDRSYLSPICATPSNEYFSAYGDTSTFQIGQREHFCDCGAFEGPIVRKFLEASNYRYESITAFEPDGINFAKLQSLASTCIPEFHPVNKAISNVNDVLRFKQTGTVSSHASVDGNISIETTRLDDELQNLTLLKMDIEGYEAKAIQGASRLISTHRPRIAACVYHYALDLLDVVDQLDKIVENYHFRLRQHSSSYYYDLVLYASPVPGAAPPPWAC